MSVKNCIYLFITFGFLYSCKNKEVTFNDNLVSIQKSVLTQVQDFGKKLQEINTDPLPLSNIKSEAQKIALHIDTKIKEAQRLIHQKAGKI